MSRLPFAPPIEEIEVDVEAAELRFKTRPGTTFSSRDLGKALRDAGYDVGDVRTSEPSPDASK